MDANVKKTALRMIPYGLYVLTAKGKDDTVAAATVNWVTQASFTPPLVVVGVKVDSHVHALIKESKAFALNVLGKGQRAMAFTFFKPAAREGQTISGEPFRWGTHRARPSSSGRPPSSSAGSWTRSSAGTTRSSSARWWRRACPSPSRAARTTRRSG